MYRGDAVRSAFAEFASIAGLTRKARSWYRRSDQTIVVLTPVRAPYGRQYFLSVGVVLRVLDADETPKDKHAPIRSRFDRLVPAELEHRVNDLLDLEYPLSAALRREELLRILRSELLPLIDASSTLDGLRAGAGHELIRHSTVNEEARDVLAVVPSE